MKIAIDAIEPQKALKEVDVETGTEIVGGESGVNIDAEAFAIGDFTFAQSGADTYTFSKETDLGKFSFSVGLGYGLGYSFTPAKP